MDLEPVDLLPQTMSGHDESLRKKAMEMLVEDGEEVYSLTPRPLFLVFARTILVDCCEVLSDLKVGFPVHSAFLSTNVNYTHILSRLSEHIMVACSVSAYSTKAIG